MLTGVTSGIGLALTSRLIEAGATVLGIARDAEKLLALSDRFGPRFRGALIELAGATTRRNALAEQLSRFDKIDAVINNAAEVVYESPLELDLDRWRSLFEVNFFAGVELVSLAAPRIPRGGQVINVSSAVARFLPNSKFAPYAITKAAIDRATEAIRLELDPRGVRVTSIVPGLVDTPIYEKTENFEKTLARIKEQIPTWLSADDLADAVMWTLERPEHVVIGEMVIMPRGQTR